MTTTSMDNRPVSSVGVTEPQAQVESHASAQQSSQHSRNGDLRSFLPILGGLLVLVVLIFEFVFSTFVQKRSQEDLLNEFRNTLSTSASAYGQPGLSPLPGTAPALGSAVAFIQIPSIGLSQVVAEGTSSHITQTAPGHAPGSALPGQAGEAIVVGRRATFGAPFYGVPNLKVGATILVTTIEGTSKYQVIDANPDALPANRLVLRTSNPPVLSLGVKDVYAQLQGLPFVPTPKNAPNEPHQSPWPSVIIAIQLVVISLISVGFTNKRFSRTITWLLCSPLVFGAVLALGLAINSLLPSTV